MDLDDLFDDGENDPQKPVTYQQQRMLDRHNTKRNRTEFRAKEQRRREKEQELFEPEHDYYGTSGSRHVPKSVVGYKPFKWPMIRFGKFRDRSRVGFDAEMRREMGNITHEAGVSCFLSMEFKNGYLIREHQGRSSWTVGFDPNRLLYPWLKQMAPQYKRWLTDRIPMDIFLIRGYLASFGRNDEWLNVGADGEYLIDVRKPHKIEHVDPDHLWLHDWMTLRQYYESMQPSYFDDDKLA